MTRRDARSRPRPPDERPRREFAEADFDLADRLDTRWGISAIEDDRRRELMTAVHCLAEADRTVEEVRRAMLGPYGGLWRLTLLRRRTTKAVARVAALNEDLRARLDEVSTQPGGERAAEILRDRSRLHLEVEAELVACLSPERRAVIEAVRRTAP